MEFRSSISKDLLKLNFEEKGVNTYSEVNVSPDQPGRHHKSIKYCFSQCVISLYCYISVQSRRLWFWYIICWQIPTTKIYFMCFSMQKYACILLSWIVFQIAFSKILVLDFEVLLYKIQCIRLQKRISLSNFLFLPQFFYPHHDLTHINPQCPQSLHRLHRLFPSITLSSSTIISSFPPKKFPAKNLFLRYKVILFSTKKQISSLMILTTFRTSFLHANDFGQPSLNRILGFTTRLTKMFCHNPKRIRFKFNF